LESLKIQDGGGRHSDKKIFKIVTLTDRHHPTRSILPNKTINIIKQNWNQFLLVVKTTAHKQLILSADSKYTS